MFCILNQIEVNKSAEQQWVLCDAQKQPTLSLFSLHRGVLLEIIYHVEIHQKMFDQFFAGNFSLVILI